MQKSVRERETESQILCKHLSVFSNQSSNM